VFYSVPEKSGTRLADTRASFWYQTTGTSFCDMCRRLYIHRDNVEVPGTCLVDSKDDISLCCTLIDISQHLT